jgi:hypothetical protein
MLRVRKAAVWLPGSRRLSSSMFNASAQVWWVCRMTLAPVSRCSGAWMLRALNSAAAAFQHIARLVEHDQVAGPRLGPVLAERQHQVAVVLAGHAHGEVVVDAFFQVVVDGKAVRRGQVDARAPGFVMGGVHLVLSTGSTVSSIQMQHLRWYVGSRRMQRRSNAGPVQADYALAARDRLR